MRYFIIVFCILSACSNSPTAPITSADDMGLDSSQNNENNQNNLNNGSCDEDESVCDGECVNTNVSALNCGDCNEPCVPPIYSSVTRCFDGECEFECLPLREDRDGDLHSPLSNGCESECAGGADAEFVCDGLDDDCNGEVDEGYTTTYYRDADGDGYGDLATVTEACDAPVEGNWVLVAGDCDDMNDEISPDVEDICGNQIDDNCDGPVDETCPCEPDEIGMCCVLGTRTCDANGAWGPCQNTPAEVCDGNDNDCDGTQDNGLGELSCPDPKSAFGVCAGASVRCSDPSLYEDYEDVRMNQACSEEIYFAASGGTYEGTAELTCDDGLDNDCDGDPDCSDIDCEQDPNCALADVYTVFVSSTEVTRASSFAILRSECEFIGAGIDASLVWTVIAADENDGPATHVLVDKPVVLMTGTRVADAGKLFTDDLMAPINITESGNPTIGGAVWTGSDNSGELENNCNGYGFTGEFNVGDPSSTSEWLDDGNPHMCSPMVIGMARVYCISQGPI